MKITFTEEEIETLKELPKEERAVVLLAAVEYLTGEEAPAFTGSKLIAFRYLTKSKGAKQTSSAAERQRRCRERKRAEALKNNVTNGVTDSVTGGMAERQRREIERKEPKERNSLINPEEVIYISPEERECAFISEIDPEADFKNENENCNVSDFEETATETESNSDFVDVTEENNEPEEPLTQIGSLSLTKGQARKLAEAQERLSQARRERLLTASEPTRISAINTAQPLVEETAEPEPYAERKAKIAEAETPAVQRKRFKKPTFEEVSGYCKERNNHIDPQTFLDFYESKGWLVGKTPMRDWRAAIRTWEKRETGGAGYSARKNQRDAWKENHPHFQEDIPIPEIPLADLTPYMPGGSKYRPELDDLPQDNAEAAR